MIRRAGVFVTTKKFEGVYCSYRRWKSPYAYDKRLRAHTLTIKVVFESHSLGEDKRVIHFDNDCFTEFNKLLVKSWRDCTIVSLDDPELPIFKAMEAKGLIKLSLLPEIGAEMFAHEIFNWFKVWLTNSDLIKQVDVRAVEVVENDFSSSLYTE